MTTDTTPRWLREIIAARACHEAVDWARPYPTADAAWAACERGDWMEWWLRLCALPIPAAAEAAYYAAMATARAAYDAAVALVSAAYNAARAAYYAAVAPARSAYDAAVATARAAYAAAIRDTYPTMPTVARRTT